jgi:hypothetical protein
MGPLKQEDHTVKETRDPFPFLSFASGSCVSREQTGILNPQLLPASSIVRESEFTVTRSDTNYR